MLQALKTIEVEVHDESKPITLEEAKVETVKLAKLANAMVIFEYDGQAWFSFPTGESVPKPMTQD